MHLSFRPEGEIFLFTLRELQFAPLRVAASDQRVLLLSPPFLNFFFPAQGGDYVTGFFEIDKFVHVVFFGKTFHQLVLVFVNSALQIIGDADIQHSIVPVCQEDKRSNVYRRACKLSPHQYGLGKQ